MPTGGRLESRPPPATPRTTPRHRIPGEPTRVPASCVHARRLAHGRGRRVLRPGPALRDRGGHPGRRVFAARAGDGAAVRARDAPLLCAARRRLPELRRARAPAHAPARLSAPRQLARVVLRRGHPARAAVGDRAMSLGFPPVGAVAAVCARRGRACSSRSRRARRRSTSSSAAPRATAPAAPHAPRGRARGAPAPHRPDHRSAHRAVHVGRAPPAHRGPRRREEARTSSSSPATS